MKQYGPQRDALRQGRFYAVRKQEKMMSKEDIKRNNALLDRRTLLRAGAAAAFAAPIGVLSAQAFPFRAATPAIDFSEFPICKTSSEAPPLTGAPRKLKMSWNAGAVCLAPLPVAIDHGFFKRQNLDVELVNYSGSTDQLLEAIATGKTDAGLRSEERRVGKERRA